MPITRPRTKRRNRPLRKDRSDPACLAEVPSIPERVARRLGEDCQPTADELTIADETIELAMHRLRQQYLDRMRRLGKPPRYDETDDD